MLSHAYYRSFTMNYVGRMVNHDDTIPEAKLDRYVRDTDLAWKKRNAKRREAMAPPLPPQYASKEELHKPEVLTLPIGGKTKSAGKGKFLKSLFSSSSTTDTTGKSPATSRFDVIYKTPSLSPSVAPANGYQTETKLFNGKYIQGSYTSSPPYKAIFESPKEEDSNRVVDEIGYDQDQISFHDKSKFTD
jgi:hypothetical protein